MGNNMKKMFLLDGKNGGGGGVGSSRSHVDVVACVWYYKQERKSGRVYTFFYFLVFSFLSSSLSSSSV